MGIFQKLKDHFLINRQDSIIFEVTQRCNNNCLFCYNVWKNEHINYPQGELPTEQTKQLIRKIIRESQCRHFTFTGGEPLLRADLLELISFTKTQGVEVTIISNGTLITEQVAADYIKQGVSLFELPLLSADRNIHNYLSQSDSFDKVTEAMANIKLHDGLVVAVFVGTKKNIDGLGEMIELARALGVDGIMFNRFNVGGAGCQHIDELLPTPGQVHRALAVVEKAMERYQIGISCSIAIQPCVVDTSVFKKIHFGYCAAGTKRAYYTVDPMGNLRMCNHTPSILGNLFARSFRNLTQRSGIKSFMKAVPEFCRGCRLEHICQGGCKAAAEACYGSLSAEEPFLRYYQNTRFKNALSQPQPQAPYPV